MLSTSCLVTGGLPRWAISSAVGRGLVQRSSTQLFLEPTPLADVSTRQGIAMGSDPATSPQWASVVLVGLSALAIAISYADRSNLSTAIIPMAKELNWNSLFSGLVLSAFWAGYATTQVLGGALADAYGGELLLVLAMLLWSCATALTPLAAAAGTVQVLGARVLLGVGEGLALPSVHSMLRRYVPKGRRSVAASVVTSACFLGALLSNYIAPIVIEKFDWQTCFYGFALIPSLIWLPLWGAFLFYKGAAGKEKVSPVSTGVDVMAQKEEDEEDSATVMQLLKSPPVWAIISAQYGQSWGMIGLLSWLPTYYSQRFNVPIASLAEFTVLPYFLQLGVSLLAGGIADNLIAKGVRILSVRKTLQTLGMVAPAVCLAYCSYATGLSAVQAASFITLGSALSALTVGAVSCNHFDISSKKNAGTIFGIGNTASCIGGLVGVPISGFVYDQTHSWSLVFGLFAFHYLGGAYFYNLWADDKPIVFASEEEKKD